MNLFSYTHFFSLLLYKVRIKGKIECPPLQILKSESPGHPRLYSLTLPTYIYIYIYIYVKFYP